MRLRRNLWTSLANRCPGLAGDLTAQLSADVVAVDHERRPSHTSARYAPLPRADWWLNTARTSGTVSR